ncbi:DUF4349 domain-containing protein [Streptomyces sp. WAC06614]|nr:DUF4349 domain-containing protein [Streptomyces sp. WAC06614]
MHAYRDRTAVALAVVALSGALALTGCAAEGEGGAKSSADRAAVAPGAPQAQGEGAKGAAGSAPSAAAGASGAPGTPGAPAVVRPHVIRTATLALESPDAQKALAAARTAAEGAGGYVGDESTERAKDGTVTSTMTLRVPNERFDAVLAGLEGGGKLRSRKVEAQDVTEKVTDVDSRVRSAQASVARVREMMEKASGLGDVVMLEGELSRRQADLEALLAQQTTLKDRTALGTITLRVSEPVPAAAGAGKKPDPGFTDALKGGLHVFVVLLKWLAVAAGAVLPFALAAGVGAVAWRGYRRLRPRPSAPAPAPAAAAGQAFVVRQRTTEDGPTPGPHHP